MQRIPFVFNSPHSGRIYPHVLPRTSRDSIGLPSAVPKITSSTSCFRPAYGLGAPLLVAQFPARLSRRQPRALRARSAHVRRAACRPIANISFDAGRRRARHGAAHRRPKTWKSIAARLPVDEALERIETDLQALSCLPAAADCPHPCAVRAGGPDRLPFDAGQYPAGRQRPAGRISSSATATAPARRPICRGRRCSCWRISGFSVVRNKPYAGGFITEHYGRPARGLHALQIEVNRGLYVDEATLREEAGFRRWLQADQDASSWAGGACGRRTAPIIVARCRISFSDSRLLPDIQPKKTALVARLSLGRKHPRRVFTATSDCRKKLLLHCTIVKQIWPQLVQCAKTRCRTA